MKIHDPHHGIFDTGWHALGQTSFEIKARTQIHTDDEAVAAILPSFTNATCLEAVRIVIKDKAYSVSSSRMPGEVGAQGAFFSAFVEI